MTNCYEIYLPLKPTGVILDFDNISEKALIERAKKDPEAFGLLFDKYYDDIFRYILHRTADRNTADDLTSDTFHKALEKLWKFKWMNLPFSAWLYRIATNEVNGFYRYKKKYSAREYNEEMEISTRDEDNPENEVNENELFSQLQKAIEKLDAKYQTVIVLKYFEEKSIKEICKITGKAEGTIKSLIHRGLKLLEQNIDKELYKEFQNE